MDKRINFRLPDSMYEEVQQAVKTGKFKDASALIRAAITQFLKVGA